MNDESQASDVWAQATWEGSRREQLRRSMQLTVRQRLEALEAMGETSTRLAAVRERRPKYPSAPADGHVVPLAGCAPTPLASYLKALGVLRIVCEQADADARGCWRDDRFFLMTRLSQEELEEFFAERYCPTPLVAPWGGRSGFYPGSSEKAAREALNSIEASDIDRLAVFRETIAEVRALLVRMGLADGKGDKLELLRACRSELPDHILPWLDACYVLTDESRAFPPLLGTGGNEGSGSYVSGFAQLVVACIIERTHNDAIAPSLFGTARPSSSSNQTPGQFDPLAAGGANAGSGFAARPTVNPWDYLLCLEGTLLFAAAVTKRLEADTGGGLSFPFTVHAVGAGAGSVAQADEASARAHAETWFPLWDRPATLGELTTVLAEGRVQVSGRTARDALDFARAVASLGMQRGITSFQRYGYLQRFGRSVIAVAIDRVEVRRNPRVDLVDDLEADGWLEKFRRLRRDPAPARLRSVISRLENALFNLARDDHASRVQAVLIELGHAQAYLARSPGTRDMVAPVPRLPKLWVEAADDGSAEFRIAAALAGLHGTRTRDGAKPSVVLPMAVHFAPVEIVGPAERTRWLEDAAPDVTWGAGNLTDNLARLAEQRMLPTSLVGLDDSPWAAWTTAPLDAVAAFLDREVDHIRISDLLQGLVLGRIPKSLPHVSIAAAPLPPAFGVLKPLFTTHGQLARAGLAGERGGDRASADSPAARTAASVVRLLDAGRVAEAVRIGVRRMRAAGMPAMSTFDDASHPDGRVLLAALLVPLSDSHIRRAVGRVTRRDREAKHSNSNVS